MIIPKTKKNAARKTGIKCFFNLGLPLLLIVIWNKKMFLELYPIYDNLGFVLGLNFNPNPKQFLSPRYSLKIIDYFLKNSSMWPLEFLPNSSKQPKCQDKSYYQSKGCIMLVSMLMGYWN